MLDSNDITPEDTATVQRITRLRLDGLTTEEIAEALNNEGIPNDAFYKLTPMRLPQA
ncbi:hypothetical protein [Kitasatospora sp. NBC_01302]|uniref:hypothetical protein n=1 Tax=Kitasatospora sp. NBC_01302 TaxID=2903575 RepID=UPI002E0F8A82|nr:recombinase family protein [Kitasatospora sp. NBC_01302]